MSPTGPSCPHSLFLLDKLIRWKAPRRPRASEHYHLEARQKYWHIGNDFKPINYPFFSGRSLSESLTNWKAGESILPVPGAPTHANNSKTQTSPPKNYLFCYQLNHQKLAETEAACQWRISPFSLCSYFQRQDASHRTWSIGTALPPIRGHGKCCCPGKVRSFPLLNASDLHSCDPTPAPDAL